MTSPSNSNVNFNELISSTTQELIFKAAKKQNKPVNEWLEDTLKHAVQHTLHPEAAHDLSEISLVLKNIDQRLANIEKNPLHGGAKVISEGAKAFTDSARDIYEKVEARKWFDKSYEAAAKVCDTVSDQFKTWWETRSPKTTTPEDQNPIEGEIIKKPKTPPSE